MPIAALSLLVAMTVTSSGALGVSSSMASTFFFEGRLGNATGTFDFTFRLFDSVSGGNVVGGSESRQNVPVANGEFRVQLDWGFSTWNGSQRFVEVKYRAHTTNASAPYTTQAPRTPALAVPYALNANQAGYASYASSAGSTDYLGGYPSSDYYRGTTAVQYTSDVPLNAGQSKTIVPYGFRSDVVYYWQVNPLNNGGRLHLEVDQVIDAGTNTIAFYLTVTNTGTSPTNFQLLYAQLKH